MAKTAAIMLVALALAVVVATSAGGASAADCNITQLAVCKAAIVGREKPTPACCSNLRAQEACLCKYQKDPKYGKYVPNARKLVTTCGMAIPNF